MDMNITIEVKNIEPEQVISLLASIGGVEQKPAKRRGRPRLSDEERKARKAAQNKAWNEANKARKAALNKAYREANKEAIAALNKAYREANREQVLATQRLCKDRRAHAHIEGYVPTSEYKKDWSIKDVTDRGYLYLAHDRETGAMKIGCTQCAPETRLANYKKESDGITFLKVSTLLNDVYNAEAAAHTMLRGNVRFVRTDNKFKDAVNKLAEWFQMNGKFAIADVLRVFDEVSRQFADTSKNDPQTSK